MKPNYLSFLLVLLPLQALADAGEIRFVQGSVNIQLANGKTTQAQRGSKIAEGDIIITGSTGYAQLTMSDDTVIAVRPDTQLKVETYRYSGKEDGNEKSVFGLLRGGFRTITGWIGRKNKDAYLVRTPTATIGIRGTDHESLYIPVPGPGQTSIGEPGTYDRVNTGQTVIQTSGGRIELNANQIGFAAARPDTVPVRLAHVPLFMRSTPPLRQDTNKPGGTGASSQPQQGTTSPQSSTTPPAPSASSPPPSTSAPSTTAVAENPVIAAVSAPPATTVAPLPQTGTVDLRYVAASSIPAPNGFTVAGGDLSPGQSLGNGSGFVGNPLEGMAILLDSAGNPLSVGTNGGFNYDRAGAAQIDAGSATVGGKLVRWGIYAGGAISDNMGPRYPQYFFFMGGGEATTFTNLQAALPVNNATLTFSTVGGYTKPITESGSVGGTVTSLSIELKNLGGSINVSAYNIGVTDAQGRIWSAYMPTPELLKNFVMGGSGSDNLNVSCSGCAQSSGTGSGRGMAIGNPAPAGFISSYTLKAGASGVAGSALAR